MWYKPVITVFAVVLAAVGIYFARAVLTPLLLGLLGYFLLNPFVRRAEHLRLFGKPLGRIVATSLVFAVGIAVTVGVGALVWPEVQDQMLRVVDNLPHYTQTLKATIVKLEERYQLLQLPEGVEEMVLNTLDSYSEGSPETARRFREYFTEALNGLLMLFFTPFITYYLLLEGATWKKGFIGFFPKGWQEDVTEVLDDSAHAVSGYIKGQILLMFVMFVLAWAGLAILGVKNSLALAVLAGFTKAIPIIGIVIAAVPAALVALQISPETALAVVIFYSIVQLIENKAILPVLMARYVEMSALGVLIALMVGEQLGGVFGMFLATPVAAMFSIVAHKLRKKYD